MALILAFSELAVNPALLCPPSPVVTADVTSVHINGCVTLLLSIDLCLVALACFSLNCDFVLRKLRPSNTTRRKCLVKAAAEILWRAGEERQATVVMYDYTFSKKISCMQSSTSRRKRSHERHT